MADAPDQPVPPERRVEITGGHGHYVGDHGIQVNLFGDRRPSGPVVAGSVPQAPIAFQPREDLLARLRTAGPGGPLICALTGLRGVGKTQLAAAYASECRQAGWRLVAWVNAETGAAVLDDLAVTADRLGIDVSGKTREALGAEVRNRLEADGARCLIVFDNVASFATIRPYVPALGDSQVLITSTSTVLPVPATPLTVGVFTEEEAVAFLAERVGRDDLAGARALAGELGCLPLALAQAAAVIAAQRLSYQVYRERLHAYPAERYLLPAGDDPYTRGTAEAVLMSVDAVAAADPTGVCIELLEVVSLLSPDGVSRSLLYEMAASLKTLLGDIAADVLRESRLYEVTARAGGVLRLRRGRRSVRTIPPEAVDEALGRLADASLLTFSGAPGADPVVAAHRLVMRVVRERSARVGTWSRVNSRAAALLDKANRALDGPEQDPAEVRGLARHFVAIAGHIASGLVVSDDELVLRWLAKTKVFAKVQARMALGWRIMALSFLGELAEQAAEAIELGEPLVADCVRILGEDDQYTRMARYHLARAYQAAGRFDEALPLLQQTPAGYARVRGANHPKTVVGREQLPDTRAQAGGGSAGPPN